MILHFFKEQSKIKYFQRPKFKK